MQHNECLNTNINPNSLKVDKELTQMARDISTRMNQRMTQVERKANDLEKFSRLVALRVNSAASRMANLKNHKAVRQVISTQNIPNSEDMRVDSRKSSGFTQEFLDSYKNAIINAGNTMNFLENPTVFTSGYIGEQSETNGNANGQSASRPQANRNRQRASSSDEDEVVESSRSRVEIGNGVEQPKIDIGPRVAQTVEEPVTLAAPPQPKPPKPSPSTTAILVDQVGQNGIQHSPQDVPKEVASITSQNENSLAEHHNEKLVSESAMPIEKGPTRPAAMASVIGEMKKKVAAKAKLLDSDSDTDREPLGSSETESVTVKKLETSTVEVVKTSISADPVIVIGHPKIEVIAAVATVAKTEKPAASKVLPKAVATPVKPAEATPAKPDESALSRKILANELKPVDTKKLVSSLFDSDSDSDTDIFKPTTSIKKQPTEVVKKSVPPKPVEVKKVETPKPSQPPQVKPTNHTAVPATKPVAKKSLFSSDSDSDDDFLKSFSKSKPVAKTESIPVVKKPIEPVVVPKAVDIPAPKPTPVTNTTAVIPKVEFKKPAAKSLFDDSDSDSDLFSLPTKPKTPIAPKNRNSSIVTQPEMEPSSSEPAKPAKPSITKKEPPSETMSAKISLIGDLQKSFRLPGSTPNIPVKNLPVSDENDVAAENPEDHVGSILKSRCRGPSNRRPPTRPNASSSN
ncbi:WASH complex subunit FAM21 [Caenorhabditis elegans]|uniref:WASH complex subunit FAM21 n=1 Tax=Caenorhabditis elegans TaxID=6239 RepID=Q17676_CAEEL|nr:WASH complex subunit FAM21 [Caenorhabditis elegans]CAA94105.1 WASH complex subunit FAM21 [Caenorhabditis elegans]|eukprot:NP_510448.1 Uncharacterized protein CELE_C05G5.2 [Caenorhabditis elegans]